MKFRSGIFLLRIYIKQIRESAKCSNELICKNQLWKRNDFLNPFCYEQIPILLKKKVLLIFLRNFLNTILQDFIKNTVFIFSIAYPLKYKETKANDYSRGITAKRLILCNC